MEKRNKRTTEKRVINRDKDPKDPFVIVDGWKVVKQKEENPLNVYLYRDGKMQSLLYSLLRLAYRQLAADDLSASTRTKKTVIGPDNLDRDPLTDVDGWKVVEHQKGGRFKWDPSEMYLYRDGKVWSLPYRRIENACRTGFHHDIIKIDKLFERMRI